MKALRDVAIPLANFFASGVANLGAKLGPFLWQLPPRLAFERARIAAFLALLPRDTRAAAALASRHDARVAGRAVVDCGAPRPLLHAMEVRHRSFEDPSFRALLREHGVAVVCADTAGRWPFFEATTAGFAYARLHGDARLYVSGYTRRALGRWAERIARWREGGDVYCYFDNDAKVRAPIDAQNLRTLVAGSDRFVRLPPGARSRLRGEAAR